MKDCLLVFGIIGVTFGLCAVGGGIGYLLQLQFHFGEGLVIFIGFLFVCLGHFLINQTLLAMLKKQGRLEEYRKWKKERPLDY